MEDSNDKIEEKNNNVEDSVKENNNDNNVDVNENNSQYTRDSINFLSKIQRMQINSLRKKAQKIENDKKRNKVEKGKYTDNIKSRKNVKIRNFIFSVLTVFTLFLIIFSAFLLTIIDTNELKEEYEFKKNIAMLSNKLKKIKKQNMEYEDFVISSLDSKIVVNKQEETIYMYIDDALLEFKNDITKDKIGIINGNLVYMGNDSKLMHIAEKEGLKTDYSLFTDIFIDDDDFEFDKDTGTILKYNGKYDIVYIPNTIDDVVVSKIGNNAFSDLNIRVVVMANTITDIYDYAFANNDIFYIRYSNMLKSIGDNAFYKNKLEEVELSKNVVEIGRFAFACNKIKNIKIENELTSLGAGCFNQNYVSEEDAYLYKSAQGNDIYEIVSYAGNSTEVIIKEGVEKIGDYAFSKNSVYNIESYSKISKINIPNTVVIIGNYAFENNDITAVNLNEHLLFIGDFAFKSNKIKSLDLQKLENIYLGVGCFNDNLTSDDEAYIITNKIIIGQNVEYDGKNLVAEIASRYMLDENETETQGCFLDSLINNEERYLISYAGKYRKKLLIPYSITEIVSYSCANLKIGEINLSTSITKVGEKAFANNNLTNITIPENINNIGYDAFYNNPIESIVILGKDNFPDTFDNSFTQLTSNITFN